MSDNEQQLKDARVLLGMNSLMLQSCEEEADQLRAENARLTAELDDWKNGTEALSYGLAYIDLQEAIDRLTAVNGELVAALNELLHAVGKDAYLRARERAIAAIEIAALANAGETVRDGE